MQKEIYEKLNDKDRIEYNLSQIREDMSPHSYIVLVGSIVVSILGQDLCTTLIGVGLFILGVCLLFYTIGMSNKIDKEYTRIALGGKRKWIK